jgi:predicted transcriptional regulator
MEDDEIYAGIVKTARSGAKSEKIMQACSSSIANLDGYLDSAERQGLIAYDPKANTYTATRKGLNFLEAHKDAVDVMRPLRDLA